MSRSAIRPALVFVLSFGILVGALHLLTRGNRQPARRGIRIETTAVNLDDHPVSPSLPLDGLPKPLYVENPRHEHYERPVEGSGAPDRPYLRRTATCDRIDLETATVENVRCLVFLPPPLPGESGDGAAARVAVTLSAGRARVGQDWFRTAAQPDKGEDWWKFDMWDGVEIETTVPRKAKLTASDLSCLGTVPVEEGKNKREGKRDGENGEKKPAVQLHEVKSEGPIEISADECKIRGRGFTGNLELSDFTVHEAVEVSFPTSLLLKSSTDSLTQARCRGPLRVVSVEEKGGGFRTQVTFENEVRVWQAAEVDGEEQVLTADRLVVTLGVRPGVKTEEENEGKAEVPPLEISARLLVAEGFEPDERKGAGEAPRDEMRVTLRSGETSILRAKRIELLPLVEGESLDTGTGKVIVLTGPLRLRHEGALGGLGPVPESAAPVTTVLVAKADRGARIEIRPVSEKKDEAEAVFEGNVQVRRETPAGAPLLTLDAETLALEDHPERGLEMHAKGGARFLTPTTEGSADSIHWSTDLDQKEVFRLSGQPLVRIRGGASFNPFGAAKAPDTPDDDAPVVTSLIVIRSKGDMLLETRGESRSITIDDGATIRKTVDDEEVFHVRAARITAKLEGEEVESVEASGLVEASGRGEGSDAGTYFASGDGFHFAEKDGLAVLAGSPAEARIVETPERDNVIRAPQLIFHTRDNRFVASRGVKAVVFLEEAKEEGEGGKIQPFVLHCDRLEVVPSSAKEASSSPAGRITSLLATGNLSLHGKRAVARGDRLAYQGGEKTNIALSGQPATLIQDLDVGGELYRDTYESPEFVLQLEDQDISKFDAPRGGRFLLHRAVEGEGPSLLGAGTGPSAKQGQVERFSGGCTGPLTYDTVNIRMSESAWIEQALGDRTGFRKVARFDADRIDAVRGIGPDGEYRLTRARGVGRVRGKGEGWELACTHFEVDLLRHLTIVKGDPARIVVDGVEQQASQAIYDYVKDQWEIIRGRLR